MPRIILLSTDTPHHRYFINALERDGLRFDFCLFETEPMEPPFAVGPLFEEEERVFEATEFFRDLPSELEYSRVRTCSRIGQEDGLALLDAIQPDFGVVFGTGRLPKRVITRFPDGLINVHRGIAELYRGLDSDLWAIYHNDYAALGVTIHRVDENLDTGAVVAQERMPVHPGMRTWQIRCHTTLIATRLVGRALRAYLEGRLTDRPQESPGRYYSFMPLELKKGVACKFDRYCERLSQAPLNDPFGPEVRS
jgi:folate-dependent phosphoribosylglycinamide formyltransferase PurN